MARDEKPPQLRTVDEEPVPQDSVIRLGERDSANTRSKVEDRPLRLGPSPVAQTPQVDAEVSRRLVVPDKDEVELRTHQPGIDALIETSTPAPELLEQAWGEASAKKNPIPWGWFALIGIAITGAVIWSATRVKKADEVVEQIRRETQTTLVDEAQEDLEAARLIERIEGTVKAFFAATTVESLARVVRHRERVEPLMRSHYAADRPVHTASLRSVRLLQPVTLDKHGNFWMASVILSNQQNRSLIVEIGTDGTPLVDWETSVCHQPMAWDDFVKQRPAGTSLDFRVYIERDHYNSHEFSDTEQWTSFRLTALDSEETLFGYAKAGSEEERNLLGTIEANAGRKASVILRLVIPEGLQARRSAVIEKLVNPRWLYIDPPVESP